jgi:hypothetical protein
MMLMMMMVMMMMMMMMMMTMMTTVMVMVTKDTGWLGECERARGVDGAQPFQFPSLFSEATAAAALL